MTRIDEWVIGIVTHIVNWLNDWLSVSQRQIEKVFMLCVAIWVIFTAFFYPVLLLGLTLLVATSFCYVSVSQVDGERGSKRKASLAKLKEWFGTLDWIPAPQTEGV